MLVHLLKSKIHRATVTAASVDYEGSLTLDEDFIDAARLHPYERILCSNMGKPGDRVTIMSFTEVEAAQAATHQPTVIILGDGNQIVNRRGI